MKMKFFAGLATGLFLIGIAGIANATPVQWAGNGHWYDYVQYQSTWDEAKSDAETQLFSGLNGYLATLTSQEENGFVWTNFPVNTAWLGGYQIGTPDPVDEPGGNWAWVTGEAWAWTNWYSPIEPNDAGGDEDHLQFWNNNGTWNDLHNNWDAPGYIVEYGSAPVPEPATMLLFGTGLAGLIGSRISKKKML